MTIKGLKRFTGRKVLVTGAASGIGRATALRFLEEGAQVVFVDRDRQKLAAVMEGLDASRAFAFLSDISIPSEVAELVSFTKVQLGGLNVLVNNAGVTALGTVLDCDLETWGTVCATILTGTINVSRSFLPLLIESKGNIVNTASVSGMRGDWNTAYYRCGERRSSKPHARHGDGSWSHGGPCERNLSFGHTHRHDPRSYKGRGLRQKRRGPHTAPATWRAGGYGGRHHVPRQRRCRLYHGADYAR